MLADFNKWLSIANQKETWLKKKKKELSIETIERIVKLIQEGKPKWGVVKDVGCFQSAVSKVARMFSYKRKKKKDVLHLIC